MLINTCQSSSVSHPKVWSAVRVEVVEVLAFGVEKKALLTEKKALAAETKAFGEVRNCLAGS
jgi:hypothetical protein